MALDFVDFVPTLETMKLSLVEDLGNVVKIKNYVVARKSRHDLLEETTFLSSGEPRFYHMETTQSPELVLKRPVSQKVRERLRSSSEVVCILRGYTNQTQSKLLFSYLFFLSDGELLHECCDPEKDLKSAEEELF